MFFLRSVFSTLLLIVYSTFLVAQDSDILKNSLQAFLVREDINGEETFEAADKAFPGDVVAYRVSYENTSKKAIRELKPILPIPEGMVFIPESFLPKSPLASIDGKEYSKIPLQREVEQSDGTVELIQVPFSEYRYLKWEMGDLNAGSRIVVEARMKVLGEESNQMSETEN